MTGLETAATFSLRKNNVTVIDTLPDPDLGAIELDHTLAIMYAQTSGVKIKMLHKLVKVEDDAIIAENVDTNELVNIPADMVIISMGVCSNNALYEQFKDKFERVVNIGDPDVPARYRCGTV